MNRDEDLEGMEEVADLGIAEPKAVRQPPPPPSSDPAHALPKVSLTVYLAASGRKFDQTAGFRHWATSRRLMSHTMPEWAQLWDAFMNRPTY